MLEVVSASSTRQQAVILIALAVAPAFLVVCVFGAPFMSVALRCASHESLLCFGCDPTCITLRRVNDTWYVLFCSGRLFAELLYVWGTGGGKTGINERSAERSSIGDCEGGVYPAGKIIHSGGKFDGSPHEGHAQCVASTHGERELGEERNTDTIDNPFATSEPASTAIGVMHVFYNTTNAVTCWAGWGDLLSCVRTQDK